MIQNGVDVNRPHENGKTTLLAAIENGMIKIMELLLLNGANPNSNNGHSPLHSICDMIGRGLEEEKRMIDSLVSKGAELNL